MIRSVQQMRGTGIEAADGPIGEVHDVYFDDSNWVVRYYVKWLPGRKVLIPPHVIRQTTPDQNALWGGFMEKYHRWAKMLGYTTATSAEEFYGFTAFTSSRGSGVRDVRCRIFPLPLAGHGHIVI